MKRSALFLLIMACMGLSPIAYGTEVLRESELHRPPPRPEPSRPEPRPESHPQPPPVCEPQIVISDCVNGSQEVTIVNCEGQVTAGYTQQCNDGSDDGSNGGNKGSDDGSTSNQ